MPHVKEAGTRTNPFDLRAVAAYGHDSFSVDDLEYVQESLGQVDDYLHKYADSSRRYGGAIGLVGGHGAGKTHLLNRIAAHSRRLETVHPTILFARAESSSLFDLLRSFLLSYTREGIRELLTWAHLAVATDYLRRAKRTEGVRSRLDHPRDLEVLYSEHNLEEDTIRRLTQERLLDRLRLRPRAAEEGGTSESDRERVPSVIPDTVLRIDDAHVGEDAFAWLLGSLPADAAEPGLDVPLRHVGTPVEGLTADDATAIATIKTLGALHEIAGVPLVLLVDEMEGLVVSPDPARRKAVSAALKELFEQVENHRILLFIAGNDESWEMRRDVFPRLRVRQPQRVGMLTLEETTAFMGAYAGSGRAFSPAQVERLRDLSGGNLRELIRIGYHVWEETDGEVGGASDEQLLQAAAEAGTIEDRRTLVGEVADRVLAELGQVRKDLEPRPGVRIDRLVVRDDAPLVAVMVVAPADQLAEVDAARSIHAVVESLADPLGGPPLIVVSVGYSSREIGTLLESAARIIRFEEASFATELRSAVVAATVRPVEAARPAAPEAELHSVLERIAERLDRIEASRQDAVRQRDAEVRSAVEGVAAPAKEARKASTRWELLDQLDSLQKAAQEGDHQGEQEILRSILIANEASLRLAAVDHLGALYMDALGDQLHGEPPDPTALARRKERIARRIRHQIMRRGTLDEWLARPWRVAAVGVAAAIVAILILDWLTWSSSPAPVLLSDYLALRLPWTVAYAAAGGVLAYVLASMGRVLRTKGLLRIEERNEARSAAADV